MDLVVLLRPFWFCRLRSFLQGWCTRFALRSESKMGLMG